MESIFFKSFGNKSEKQIQKETDYLEKFISNVTLRKERTQNTHRFTHTIVHRELLRYNNVPLCFL